MGKHSLIVLIILSLSILTACNRPESGAADTEDPNAQITEAVMTVYAQLSETAAAAALLATATFTPEPTFTETLPPTFTPTEAFTNTPLISPTETSTATPTSNLPCLRANLETKSIADGTVIFIERTFTQTYRIKNTGSCTWNAAYELRFIGGDLLNAGASIQITTGTIPTWGYANVDVLMKAPGIPGTYKGYWQIKSDDGRIFGVGPAGANSFWTEVEVIDPDA